MDLTQFVLKVYFAIKYFTEESEIYFLLRLFFVFGMSIPFELGARNNVIIGPIYKYVLFSKVMKITNSTDLCIF